ncbi:MAG: zinc-binding dehydrogenase [Alphaproteobacteria bacterium]|nr:zinc-binding dehydrogenase [Alphaproteobacteria bacterium]MCB9792326.1 zinc-binding dehydrogenase [Alphaproteobacteria bacterium]
MKQIWISKAGEPDVLELRESPDPEPGPGQVRIQVEAAGINFADIMARQGLYPDAPPLPCVVGYEVGGVIDAVGEGVDAARVGEPVIAATRFGGYSSAVVVNAGQALRRPEGMSAAEGASIVVTGMTAWMMLIEMGRVREGDRVLVHSAGGGVGLMALDLIKWRGATAIGTASGGKHAFLRERGYDELIDYREQDFAEALAGGPGLDLILDPIGGEYWSKGLGLLRTGGRLVCFGMSSASTGTSRNVLSLMRSFASVPWTRFNPMHLMDKNIGVMGVNMGHMWDEADRLAGWLVEILKLVEQGVVRPLVHAEVPHTEAAEAHAMIHRRENVGKVVITF